MRIRGHIGVGHPVENLVDQRRSESFALMNQRGVQRLVPAPIANSADNRDADSRPGQLGNQDREFLLTINLRYSPRNRQVVNVFRVGRY